MTTLRQAAQAALDKLNAGELLCEVTAASILNEALEATEQEPDLYQSYIAVCEELVKRTKERDALLAAGKLALDMCVEFSRAPMTQVEYLGLLRTISALKKAGVAA